MRGLPLSLTPRSHPLKYRLKIPSNLVFICNNQSSLPSAAPPPSSTWFTVRRQCSKSCDMVTCDCSQFGSATNTRHCRESIPTEERARRNNCPHGRSDVADGTLQSGRAQIFIDFPSPSPDPNGQTRRTPDLATNTNPYQ
jgi:hypothetical protein